MFRGFPLAILFVLSAMSFVSRAEWVQGEASLMVKDAPLDDVRLVAIKNAIADASFKSGSVITAEDVVLNGLLVSSKAEIHSTGRIQRVEIIDETITEGTLHVVVRVNITPLFSCESDKYHRSVLVTQLQLLRPRQAAYGDIYDFGNQISKRFEQQLLRQQQAMNVQLLDKAFASRAAFNSLTPQIIYDKASYLAQTQGRQFVIFGYIRDISLFEQFDITDDDESALRRNFTGGCLSKLTAFPGELPFRSRLELSGRPASRYQQQPVLAQRLRQNCVKYGECSGNGYRQYHYV